MIIQIRGITPTESREGKTYWKLETNKGDMSAFDQLIVDKLYEAWRANKEIEVDAKPSVDEKYVNIRGLGAGKPQDLGKPVQQIEITEPKQFQDIKLTSMYVSYAKDIFIALRLSEGWIRMNKDHSLSKENPGANHEGLMKLAINLVKQAHKEFS